MRVIKLDGRRMDSRAKAYAYLKEELRLPEYFGGNLDALYDCLGEMSWVDITLSYPDAALNALGDYGARMIRVFEQAAMGRGDFRFRLLRK